jgi:hypothetical protein
MANGGDCVLRSATGIPSLHRSGLERHGHKGTVAAKVDVPGVPGVAMRPFTSFRMHEFLRE